MTLSRDRILGALGLATVVGSVEPVFQLLAETSNLWFPMVAALDQFAGSFAAIPTELARSLFVGAAATYAALKGLQLLSKLWEFTTQ